MVRSIATTDCGSCGRCDAYANEEDELWFYLPPAAKYVIVATYPRANTYIGHRAMVRKVVTHVKITFGVNTCRPRLQIPALMGSTPDCEWVYVFPKVPSPYFDEVFGWRQIAAAFAPGNDRDWEAIVCHQTVTVVIDNPRLPSGDLVDMCGLDGVRCSNELQFDMYDDVVQHLDANNQMSNLEMIMRRIHFMTEPPCPRKSTTSR